MLKQNLLLILRRLRHRKSYSFIHVLGLTIGFASCLLIFLLVKYEYSFDQYHAKKDRIYRINTEFTDPDDPGLAATLPFPAGPAFAEEFSEAEAVGRLYWREESFLNVAGQSPQVIDYLYFAEADILEMFDFEIQQGEGKTALAKPGNILLSESTAKQIFGTQNPIGQEVRFEATQPLQVAGIYKDTPANTHIPADALVSYESLTKEVIGFSLENWKIYLGCTAYALFPQPIDPTNYESRLDAFSAKYILTDDGRLEEQLRLQALNDIHLSPIDGSNIPVEPIPSALISAAISIGLLILLMACFNFVNLSLASNAEKGLEVSMRKIVGANTLQIWSLSLGEAIVLSIGALLLSIGVLFLALPKVNQILDKGLQISDLLTPSLLLFGLVVILFVALVAGAYPAWMLARKKAKHALQSAKSIGQKGDSRLRQVMVVAQFVITLIIITGAVTVSRQLNFVKEKDLGFEQIGRLQVNLPKPGTNDALEKAWRSNPSVEEVTFALGAPLSDNGLGMGAYPFGGDPNNEEFVVSVKTADGNYLKTYDLELLAGRPITIQEAKRLEGYPKQGEVRPVIANEALGRRLGYDTPEEMLGKKVVVFINSFVAEIVGVTRDFNNNSLHDLIEPEIITPMSPQYYQVGIKINTNQVESTLASLANTWSTYYPDAPFEYTFLEESIAAEYDNESQILQLLNIFAGLAIFIACLGLFGLAAIFTTQRRKEIGLRKVLGASVSGIIQLLSKDIILLILVSIALAAPLAWWLSSSWLENFVYRIDFSWLFFVLAGIGLLLLALASISSQTIRAALADPADVMREE
ncbi:MAG: ABC transporter permease [Bacteroidota bacterium]